MAKSVENLRYDALAEFLGNLGNLLYARSLRDNRAGKKQLARALAKADNNITDAQLDIDKAWKICKPYMDETDS